jgi:hypothetical protein
LQLQHPQPNAVVANALIESFCVHARLLLEFFDSRRSSWADQIKAKEFTGGAYAAAHVPLLPDLLRKKINSQIAHLSEHRTDRIIQKINAVDRAFLYEAIRLEVGDFVQKLVPPFTRALILSIHSLVGWCGSCVAPGT